MSVSQPNQVRKRIMIVDDEVSVSGFLSELFSMKDYDVITFNDSQQAYDYFVENCKTIDLIISDQTMPHLTGTELAKKVFAIRENFPFILCTGYSDDVDESTALKQNIRGFLNKPFSITDLFKVVDSISTM